MSTPNDGGPAFPRTAFSPGVDGGHDQLAEAGFTTTSQAGMSLHDYFAAAALTGIMANVDQDEDGTMPTPETLAKAAWITADAMLSARATAARESKDAGSETK